MQQGDPCRTASPLALDYTDDMNGFRVPYPQDWLWQSRSDPLPGNRSAVIWLGPNSAPGSSAPACIVRVRLAMHYYLDDVSLEDMRDSTLDIGRLLARSVQARAGASPSNTPASAQPLPLTKVPTFWTPVSSNRSLWGAEQLTLPSGLPYYREVGTGSVQDLNLRERSGSIVRYVVAASPRAMLEIIGEATTPEFEASYAGVFDKMVRSLSVRQGLSPNPGPVGVSAGLDACQALILVQDMRDRPLLERSAVTQTLQVRGAAAPLNPEQPDAATESCDAAVQRMGLFLSPPTDEDDVGVQSVSVYGLPLPPSPPLRGGLDLSNDGYYLEWRIPPDLNGQRDVYLGAQLTDGRWSWVSRRINIAPPLSAAIDVNPPFADIGQQITVTMRVVNNTRSRVVAVRPILYQPEGSGTVLLRSGPLVRTGGCNLEAPSGAAQRATPTTAGGTAAAQAAEQPAAPTGPSQVELAPYRPVGPGNCALFEWQYTAVRSGSLSFSGTAEGRLQEAGRTNMGPRLLSRSEGELLAQEAPPGIDSSGETVSAPVVTASDAEIRAVTLQGDVTVLPSFGNPYLLQVWARVTNGSPTVSVYNVRSTIALHGVQARLVPEQTQDGPADVALLPGEAGCPNRPRVAGRLTREQRGDLRAGAELGVLQPGSCVALLESFELASDTPPSQAFSCDVRVVATTQHAGTQNAEDGTQSGNYPQLNLACPLLTLERLQDVLSLPSVRSSAGLSPAPGVPSGAAAPSGVAAAYRAGQGTVGQEGITGSAPGGATPAEGQAPAGLEQIARQLAANPGSVPQADLNLIERLGAAAASGQTGPTGEAQRVGPLTPVPGTSPSTAPSGSGTQAPPVATPTVTGLSVLQQAAAQAGYQLVGPPQPGSTGVAGTGVLFTRMRAYPAGRPDTRLFNVPDAIRVEMEVTNLSDLPLLNVRPGELSANGVVPTDIYANPLAGPAGGASAQASIIASAAAQAAGAAAGRGANLSTAQTAAATAAQAAQQAAAAGLAADQCLISSPAQGGIETQLRQLDGPIPTSLDRLAPGATATFRWDYYIQEYRGAQPRVTFQNRATADSADGPITGAPAESDPIERALGCIFVNLEAGPTTLTSGDEFTVTMRAQNSSAFFPGTQFYRPGLFYTDVYPPPLRAILEGDANVDLQLIDGPVNPISGGPIDFGPNQVLSFTWRYRATGGGCFKLRGQLGARHVGSGSGVFYTNLVDSDRICVAAPGRGLAQ